jgi:hypothetical protein
MITGVRRNQPIQPVNLNSKWRHPSHIKSIVISLGARIETVGSSLGSRLEWAEHLLQDVDGCRFISVYMWNVKL